MAEDKKVVIRHEADFKALLTTQYKKSIENFFGDEQRALEFGSNAVACVQRTPKLLECTPDSLMNSFMTMAALKLMPSGVSGEAYVLPYNNRKKINGHWTETLEAQFQLGYQGLVTLFYRAGAKSIVAEIVRQKDHFEYLNGEVRHVADFFADDRGEAIGAYVIVELVTGGMITKVMSKKDILAIGEKFSQTFGKDFSIWDPANDPELWTWKKTVLKQAGKLVPKNDVLFRAISEDNKDSRIGEIPDPQFKGLDAPKERDWSKERKQIEKARNIPELEKIWADLTPEGRSELQDAMEEQKAIILSAEKDV